MAAGSVYGLFDVHAIFHHVQQHLLTLFNIYTYAYAYAQRARENNLLSSGDDRTVPVNAASIGGGRRGEERACVREGRGRHRYDPPLAPRAM